MLILICQLPSKGDTVFRRNFPQHKMLSIQMHNWGLLALGAKHWINQDKSKKNIAQDKRRWILLGEMLTTKTKSAKDKMDKKYAPPFATKTSNSEQMQSFTPPPLLNHCNFMYYYSFYSVSHVISYAGYRNPTACCKSRQIHHSFFFQTANASLADPLSQVMKNSKPLQQINRSLFQICSEHWWLSFNTLHFNWGSSFCYLSNILH